VTHRLRRSQAVVPFGVGAIVDFRREALMAAGLESWPPEPLGKIEDPRLARRLGVDFFREPPAKEEGLRAASALPFVRFPLWHVCPRCRALFRALWNDRKPPRCQSAVPLRRARKSQGKAADAPVAPDPPDDTRKRWTCADLPEKKRVRMVPLRFVVACQNGHIEDFPWVQWVHRPKDQPLARDTGCEEPQLRLVTTGLSGLEGLVVRCEKCDLARSLALAAGPSALKTLGCSASRPWLGPGGADPLGCSRDLRVLQRGATNIYFANVASSILIPPFTSRARMILEDAAIWRQVTDASFGSLEKRIAFLARTRRRSRQPTILHPTRRPTRTTATRNTRRFSTSLGPLRTICGSFGDNAKSTNPGSDAI
jgi:hypothetical protein